MSAADHPLEKEGNMVAAGEGGGGQGDPEFGSSLTRKQESQHSLLSLIVGTVVLVTH